MDAPPKIDIPSDFKLIFSGNLISIPPKIATQSIIISSLISALVKSKSTPPKTAMQVAPLNLSLIFSSHPEKHL